MSPSGSESSSSSDGSLTQDQLDQYYGVSFKNDHVHLDEQQPRHAAFSSPKKIVDIFNLNGKADHRQRADASKRPKYNYSTRWDKPEQMNAQSVRQTKYQAFSIENYLKHLLKVTRQN